MWIVIMLMIMKELKDILVDSISDSIRIIDRVNGLYLIDLKRGMSNLSPKVFFSLDLSRRKAKRRLKRNLEKRKKEYSPF